MQRLNDYPISGIKSLDKKGKMNKVLSSLVTALVIGLLVFLGPVNALQLSLSGLRTSTAYTEGEKISFTGQIDIEQNDIPEIKNVSLYINGEETCTIDIWGWKFTNCDGVNIQLLEYDTAYGYGYGYNQFEEVSAGDYAGYGYSYGYHLGKNRPGHISYNITIDTPHPKLWFGGNNKVQLILNTGQEELESDEYGVMLNPLIKGDGNFLMGTYDAGLLLWGKYNQTDNTIVGKLETIGDPDLLYYAVGTYDAQTPTSGDIEFRLYNANVFDDVGIFWYGNYSAGTWKISPDPLMTEYLEGAMFVPPQ